MLTNMQDYKPVLLGNMLCEFCFKCCMSRTAHARTHAHTQLLKGWGSREQKQMKTYLSITVNEEKYVLSVTVD